MVTCVGIDLTGAEWLFSRADVPPFPEKFSAGDCRALAIEGLRSESLFGLIDSVLTVTADHLALQSPRAEDGKPLQQAQLFANVYSGYKLAHGKPEIVGITHPYRIAPAVRRVLPALLGEPIENKYKGKSVAIEAPLAAGLELVATRRHPNNGKLLVFHGTPICAELTAVMILADGPTLKLAVRATKELLLGRDAPPLADQLSDWPATIVPPNDWRLVVVGDHLAEAAEQIVPMLRMTAANVSYEDKFCAATGAARYAAYWQERDGLHGTEFERIEIEHVCSRPVGLLGVGEDGAWWCQLFARGAALPATALLTVDDAIRKSRQLPSVLVLAECGRHSSNGSTWLPRSVWESCSLQVFTSCTLDQNLLKGPQLKLELRNQSPKSRWSDQEVKVS